MNAGDGEVIELGPHEHMTVEQCLVYCVRNHIDLTEVLVIGYDPDGKFSLRAGGKESMSRKDALWLIQLAQDYIRGVNQDDDE